MDDQASILDALQLVLDDLGHETKCFLNGRQLFNHLDRESIDLLILDPHLSGMDGYEIVMRLDSSVPTVLLTAWPQTPIVSRLEEQGVLDVMVKPVSAQTLERVVSAHLTAAV